MAKYTPDSIYTLVETYLERRKDLANLGNSSSSLWLQMVGNFNRHYYQEARKVDPTRFQSTTSLAVTGNGNYTVIDLESLVGYGCGVFKSDSTGAITDDLVTKTNRGSSALGYWVDSANKYIVFTGSPAPDTYWVVYFPEVVKPTANDDDLLLDDNNDEAVVDYFRRMIDLWDMKLNMVNLDDALLQNSMRRLLGNLNPEPTAAIPLNISTF